MMQTQSRLVQALNSSNLSQFGIRRPHFFFFFFLSLPWLDTSRQPPQGRRAVFGQSSSTQIRVLPGQACQLGATCLTSWGVSPSFIKGDLGRTPVSLYLLISTHPPGLKLNVYSWKHTGEQVLIRPHHHSLQ